MTSAVLEWTYQPWRESPGRAVAALAFTAAASVLLHAAAGSAMLTVILTLAVGAQLGSLMVPTRCRVDDEGVKARGPLGWERRAWSAIRRARVGPAALMVSPYATPRRLDRFRALVLPLPRAGRDALIDALRPFLSEHELA